MNAEDLGVNHVWPTAGGIVDANTSVGVRRILETKESRALLVQELTSIRTVVNNRRNFSEAQLVRLDSLALQRDSGDFERNENIEVDQTSKHKQSQPPKTLAALRSSPDMLRDGWDHHSNTGVFDFDDGMGLDDFGLDFDGSTDDLLNLSDSETSLQRRKPNKPPGLAEATKAANMRKSSRLENEYLNQTLGFDHGSSADVFPQPASKVNSKKNKQRRGRGRPPVMPTSSTSHRGQAEASKKQSNRKMSHKKSRSKSSNSNRYTEDDYEDEEDDDENDDDDFALFDAEEEIQEPGGKRGPSFSYSIVLWLGGSTWIKPPNSSSLLPTLTAKCKMELSKIKNESKPKHGSRSKGSKPNTPRTSGNDSKSSHASLTSGFIDSLVPSSGTSIEDEVKKASSSTNRRKNDKDKNKKLIKPPTRHELKLLTFANESEDTSVEQLWDWLDHRGDIAPLQTTLLGLKDDHLSEVPPSPLTPSLSTAPAKLTPHLKLKCNTIIEELLDLNNVSSLKCGRSGTGDYVIWPLAQSQSFLEKWSVADSSTSVTCEVRGMKQENSSSGVVNVNTSVKIESILKNNNVSDAKSLKRLHEESIDDDQVKKIKVEGETLTTPSVDIPESSSSSTASSSCASTSIHGSVSSSSVSIPEVTTPGRVGMKRIGSLNKLKEEVEKDKMKSSPLPEDESQTLVKRDRNMKCLSGNFLFAKKLEENDKVEETVQEEQLDSKQEVEDTGENEEEVRLKRKKELEDMTCSWKSHLQPWKHLQPVGLDTPVLRSDLATRILSSLISSFDVENAKKSMFNTKDAGMCSVDTETTGEPSPEPSTSSTASISVKQEEETDDFKKSCHQDEGSIEVGEKKECLRCIPCDRNRDSEEMALRRRCRSIEDRCYVELVLLGLIHTPTSDTVGVIPQIVQLPSDIGKLTSRGGLMFAGCLENGNTNQVVEQVKNNSRSKKSKKVADENTQSVRGGAYALSALQPIMPFYSGVAPQGLSGDWKVTKHAPSVENDNVSTNENSSNSLSPLLSFGEKEDSHTAASKTVKVEDTSNAQKHVLHVAEMSAVPSIRLGTLEPAPWEHMLPTLQEESLFKEGEPCQEMLLSRYLKRKACNIDEWLSDNSSQQEMPPKHISEHDVVYIGAEIRKLEAQLSGLVHRNKRSITSLRECSLTELSRENLAGKKAEEESTLAKFEKYQKKRQASLEKESKNKSSWPEFIPGVGAILK